MLQSALASCRHVHLVVLNQSEPKATSVAIKQRLEDYYPGLSVTVQKHPRILVGSKRLGDATLLDEHRRQFHRQKFLLKPWMISNENEYPSRFRTTVRSLAKREHFDVYFSNYAKLFDSEVARCCGSSVCDLHDLQQRRIANDVAPLWKARTRGLLLAIYKWSEWSVLRKIDRVIAISSVETNAIGRKIGKGRVQTIPMSVYPQLPMRRSDVTSDLLFIGSNSEANLASINWFIKEVWPLVIRKNPRVILSIYGSICRNRSLQSMVAQAPRRAQVRLNGFADELGTMFASTSVAISPVVRGSGMKVKVIDALLHGKAIVGTDVAFEGIAVQHTKNGMRANKPEDFAASCLTLLNDPALREKMGIEARKLIEVDHSFRVCVESFSALLDKLPNRDIMRARARKRRKQIPAQRIKRLIVRILQIMLRLLRSFRFRVGVARNRAVLAVRSIFTVA